MWGLILGVLAAVGGGPADTSLLGMAIVSTFALVLVLGIATADARTSLKQARSRFRRSARAPTASA